MEYQFVFLHPRVKRILVFNAPDDTTAIRYAARYCLEADVAVEVRFQGAHVVLLTPAIAPVYLAVTV